MESKIIQCPQCKVGLEVKNTRDEAVKSIKCPNCQTPLKVVFRQPQAQPVADHGATQLPGKPAHPPIATDPNATQLGPQPTQSGTDKTQVKPKLQLGKLVCNGVEYPLQMGRNIVGRRNTTKPTNIMLNVNDSYMSRQHICIDVVRVGDSIQARVTNYQNTNDTEVAGLPMANGEVLVLNNGTTIKMGNTIVTYRS